MMLLYPSQALEKLEFDKILALLAQHCRSEPAQQQALALEPLANPADIRALLLKVQDSKNILDASFHFPLDYVTDLSGILSLMAITDAVLEPDAYTRISRTVATMEKIFRFFKTHKGIYPHLESVVAGVEVERKIIDLIDGVFDDTMQVRDRASHDLANIRRKLQKRRTELNKVFQQVMQRFAKDGILTDSGQSIRNGRKVVTIVAESKRQVGGIIHDESDSGKTAFVEPRETIELNNEVLELERAEEREIYRILRELTREVSVYRPLLIRYQDILIEYDLIAAKTKLAIAMGGVYPILSDKPVLKLIKAYHPLLLLHHRKVRKETIPLQITLDRDQSILVISGPNAGGKTICLKTAGLLQVMLQSGLLIPCDERSEVGVFRSLFADIGDSQSIEDELSTYSSHLRAMKFFLDNTDQNTLFLIDEFGTGSDPALGGAFAEAILEELAFKRAFGVVTTHYLNLKVMAGKVKGIVNGAMIFNEETLSPTYRLTLGKPGSSYTFSIAERTGLPRILIEHAKDLVDTQHYRLDKLLDQVEQEQLRLREKDAEISKLHADVSALKSKYESQLEKLQRQQAQQAQQAAAKPSKQTSHFIKEAERRLQKLLKDWETQKDLDKVATATKQALPKEVKEAVVVTPAKKQEVEVKKPADKATLKIGTLVKVHTWGKKGTVQSIKGNRVTVIIDEVKMVVGIDDIGLI